MVCLSFGSKRLGIRMDSNLRLRQIGRTNVLTSEPTNPTDFALLVYRCWSAVLALLHLHTLFLQVLFNSPKSLISSQVFVFSPLLSLFFHHSSLFPSSLPTKPSLSDHPPIIKLKAKNGNELIPAGMANGTKAKENGKMAQTIRRFQVAFGRKLIGMFFREIFTNYNNNNNKPFETALILGFGLDIVYSF